jgi:hypothetical protein
LQTDKRVGCLELSRCLEQSLRPTEPNDARAAKPRYDGGWYAPKVQLGHELLASLHEERWWRRAVGLDQRRLRRRT